MTQTKTNHDHQLSWWFAVHLTESDVYLLRCVKTLDGVDRGKKIPTQYIRKTPEFTDENVMDVLTRLSEYSQKRGYANSTQYLYRTTATALFRFMLEQKMYPGEVTPMIVSEFIRTYGYTKKTMKSKMYALS